MEVRRHKPSVIYIPNVDVWFRSVAEVVISTFLGLLRSLAPTEPVLVLGVIESKDGYMDPRMIKDLFGFSKRNQFEIPAPDRVRPTFEMDIRIAYMQAAIPQGILQLRD